MDIVIDGVDYATRFPGKPETGHAGQSFDHAADTHGAPAPHAVAPADKSWWDSAVDGVKSAAGSADSAIHHAGAAVDHAAQSGINSATSAVRSVAGDRAANLVHGAAEAVHDNVKQSVGFSYGVGAGATEALGGMVEGTGNLVKTGAKLATDPAFRSQVAQGARHVAHHVAADPIGTAKSLGTGAVHAGQDWMRGAGKAAQEGNLGEYLGHATGSAAVNVGSFFIPGAGEADAANLASHLGQAAETATTATHALQAGSEAATTAARAERALGGAEHAAGPAEKAVNTVEHAAADPTATGHLRGKEYDLPGWHNQSVSYTKRSSDQLSTLRGAFDTGARRDFLKDLGANHADSLRAAGMNDAQISRISSGRVPAGYQVHHYLPLDDGGTNATDNLVLIRNDPDHMIVTNHQNRVTKGMSAGDTRVLDWPMPDGVSPKVWPGLPGSGARLSQPGK